MKKLVSLVLALVLVMALSITVFAAETGVGAGNYNVEVKGKYVTGTAAADSICVDISWGAMEFTYTASQKTWDTTNHVEVEGANGTWSESGNTITVKNHSNVSVTATFAFAAADGVTGVTGSAAAITLDAAAGDTVDEKTATLTLSGKPVGFTNEMAKIGTVTVTIAKTANPT